MVKAPGSSWKVLVYELVGLVMRRIIFWLRAEEVFLPVVCMVCTDKTVPAGSINLRFARECFVH